MYSTYKKLFNKLHDACEEAYLESKLNDRWTYRVWLMPNGDVKTESVFSSKKRHKWTKDALTCVFKTISHTPIEDCWDENGDLLGEFSQLFEEEFAEGKMYEEYDDVFDYILEEHYDEYVEYVKDNFMENYDYDFYMYWVYIGNDYIDINGERYTFNDCNTLVPYEEEDE